jgi:exo-beta-1,3-glucanase (GH17 family)/cellulose synthase/poly-beta-1,6-N-acetylglucosamine synthase-like glycosyltransferase
MHILLCGALINLAIWAWVFRAHEFSDWDNSALSGVSYSPYGKDQNPEYGDEATEKSIIRDLDLLRGLSDSIRLYSALGVLQTIPSHAKERGIAVTAGAWISADPLRNQREVSELIKLANRHLNVTRVLVGNETLLRQDVSRDVLIDMIAAVRGRTQKPVSTAEPWHIWLSNPALAEAVDFIGVQALPYWEGVSAQDAVVYLLAKLAQIKAAYPNKPIILTEVGWPSAGRAILEARTGRVEQARFVREFLNAATAQDLEYFIIEAFDQPWKISIEGMAGGYWGLFDARRQVKFPWSGPVRERDDWAIWALIAILAGAFPSLGYLRFRPTLQPQGALVLSATTQSFGSALVCALVPAIGLYLSAIELTVWSVLFGAAIFLGIGVLVDIFEAADLMWTGPLRRQFAPAPPAADAQSLPKVSIHVAVSNEPPVLVRRTLAALARLDYPNFEVIVLDNNTRDPALWRPIQFQCRSLGSRFRFHRYEKLTGYKGGALRRALSHCAHDAEIIAVIDSDYVVASDWLKSLVPLFADPKIGFVQAPQDYRDARESIFKNFCFWEYAGFFRIGMVRRNEADAIIQHGTMTLIRRDALQKVGGWADWCITEDAELGLRLAHNGWKSAYIAKSFGKGVMPDSLGAYKTQRYRWAYGAIQILKRRWRWLAIGQGTKLTSAQRFQYLAGWLPWISDAAGLFFTIAALAWTTALVAFPEFTELPPAAFLMPPLAAFLVRQGLLFKLYGRAGKCPPRDRAKAALAGLALSHTVAKAVISGLFTSAHPFHRTPKYRSGPRFLRGLFMASEEALILACLIAAGLSFAVTNGTWDLDAFLWLSVLAVLTLPYGATVVLATNNGNPLRVHQPARLGGGGPSIPAYPPGERRRRRQQ